MMVCACTGTKKPATGTINMQVLRGPSAIAFAHLMQEQPEIEGHPLNIRLIDSPEMMQAQMIKGEADIAVLPLINAVNLHNKGINFPLQGCPVWGTLYIVSRKESEHFREIYLFGAGTTPDILTRHYLQEKNIPVRENTLNYTFTTARELMQALLIRKAQTAVLSEPFLSMALAKDTTLHIMADLNHLNSYTGFPQTAIVIVPELKKYHKQIDSLLQASCSFAVNYPQETIRILEEKNVFPRGMLTSESIKRCMITYRPANSVQKEIHEFLDIIYRYEPKAMGGKLPMSSFIIDYP